MSSLSQKRILEILQRWDGVLSKCVEVFCVVLLAAIVVTVSISVFTRFVIFYPLNFADALAKYLMIWMAFLGAGLAIREGEHIAVNLLETQLKGKSKQVLVVLVNAGIAVFLVVVLYFGFLNAWSARHSSDPFVFGVSMMIPYLSVPVGALYALIQLTLTTIISLLREEFPEDNNLSGGSV